MRRNTTSTSLGVSLLALALAATPAFAQDTATEAEAADSSTTGQAAVVIGGTVAAGVALERAGSMGTSAATTTTSAPPAARQVSSLEQLQRRGDIARQARGAPGAGTSQMDELLRRGNSAQQARAGRIGSGANLDELARRGNTAQQARAGRIGGGANLDDLARRGNTAQQARAGRIGGSAVNLDELARRGNLAQSSRAGMRNAASVAANAPGFERGLAGRVGQSDVARLVNRGDAAQIARGRMVNEGQLMRNITSNGGDITDLNRQGRLAQSARQVDRAGDVGRAAGRLDSVSDAARIGRVAGRVDDITDIARTARVASNVGRAGRTALAGTGVGALVIAAEIVGTESVRALTGVELQDPFSTGAMYGAALFSDDISLGDVAQMRFEHHRDNFRRLGETLSDPSQIGENLQTYGRERGEDLREFGEGVQTARTNGREAISRATGADLVAPEETAARYGEALTGGNPLRDVTAVAADRAGHHLDNAKEVGGKIGCGLGNLLRSAENDRDC